MKEGNLSQAVRSSRLSAKEGLEDFPTPPWATRAFCQQVLIPELEARCLPLLGESTAWEPAANRGYMAAPLGEYFFDVQASDVADYRVGYPVRDFLLSEVEPGAVDWIITNPPFRLAAEFIDQMALHRPRVGYAVLVRAAFLEGCERYQRLFRPYPPSLVCYYAERVPMVRGRYDPLISTATAYCWLVWFTKRDWPSPTEVRWIPPCRKFHERAKDVMRFLDPGPPA